MERILQAELGGAAALDFDERGVMFTLDAPLEGLSTELSEWQFA